MERRADKGKPVGPWIGKLNPMQRAIAKKLHRLILGAVPAMTSELKWGMPCYSKDGMVCFIMAAKEHVSIGFYKGAKLKDPKELFSGSGKALRSLKFRSAGEIPVADLRGFVKAAVALKVPTKAAAARPRR
jgi:hypothetical protein